MIAQQTIVRERTGDGAQGKNSIQGRNVAPSERGFSLTELMIALMVFVLISGAVITLLVKSQGIFRTEQGVSEMDQNARLLMDFLTRDIQQAKENGLGLGPRFRSIHSYNGFEGKTDEVTIISSDTESKIPAAALPLTAATTRSFNIYDRYIEILPNGAGRLDPQAVVDSLEPDEEFIISSVLQDGSVQFDFVKAKSARVTRDGFVGLSVEPVEHRGIESEIPFGSAYDGGSFTMRPVAIKRYFIDRQTDRDHPVLSLSVNDSEPIPIARNIVAFQLRYLEVEDGQFQGQWVKEQTISSRYRTLAVEVTMTARTEIEGDQKAERLVTLASVVRPRELPSGDFGSSGGSAPGLPGSGEGSDGGGGGDEGDGPGDGFGTGPGGGPGFPGGRGSGGGSGPGRGNGPGFGSGGDGSGGWQSGGYDHRSRQIGKQPRLGERLNPRP